jgi:VIT1/CCC1 family predicted Fe2+/Mn2+ transporter
MRIPITFFSVVIALAITGTFSAKAGGANVLRATLRVVFGGALAMAVTYAIGTLFGVKGI